MARTRLQIWNGAFAAMVGGRLGSLDDRNAGPIREVYDSIVDDALLTEVWPWSVARVPLTTRDPATGQPEEYRFTMPGALPGQPDPTLERLSAGPLAVYDTEGAHETTQQRWRPSMEYIYSDAETLWATFQFHTPETTWPVQFAEYVRLRICEETIGTYKPDSGEQGAIRYQRKAAEKLGQVIDSTQQVEGPQFIFDRFQTTAARTGDYLRPIQLNDQGQALP